MDIDGVLTDGSIYVGPQGEAFKRFNSKDGIAIKRCLEHNIHVALLSAGHSPKIAQQRAKMLDISLVYVGKIPKINILKTWIHQLELTPDNVCYIGDDLPDLECLRFVGLSACPSDAAIAVRNTVDLMLKTIGGKGCVRELVDIILQDRINR